MKLLPCPFCGSEPMTTTFDKAPLVKCPSRKNRCPLSHRYTTERLWNTRQSQWIPVSERLPEDMTPVLVTMKDYPDKITAAMIYVDGDEYCWQQITGYNATLNDSDSYEFDDDYQYSHWMPLPIPPGE